MPGKPHIRLHCRRYFDGLVWRAQIGAMPDAAMRSVRFWYSTPRKALGRIEHVPEFVRLPYDPRDFMSGTAYIPGR